jgi:hypothetical protein
MGSGNGIGLLSKSETSTSAKSLSRGKRDFSKVLVWDNPDCLADFHDLVENPPLHSVVIRFEPSMAEQLLLVTNTDNRPLRQNLTRLLGHELSEDDFEFTGDTIKFSVDGTMLDGQHRLQGCVKVARPLTSHVVFGLDKKIFDVLDQGGKRTPGDILAKEGITDHAMVAAAIGWVLRLRSFAAGNKSMGGPVHRVTPRVIRKLAKREMKAVPDYVKDGKLISSAFKHVPSLCTAILYLIGQHSEALARDFAHEWVHGARRGRNQNFDVLSARLIKIARQSGGHVNRQVRAALIINTFNHWNAHVVASDRSMTWHKDWRFPKIEVNADVFLHGKKEAEKRDTSLSATQLRVLKALTEGAEAGLCELSHAEISKAANTPRGSVPYILTTLIEDELIEREGNGKFRINVDKMKEGVSA